MDDNIKFWYKIYTDKGNKENNDDAYLMKKFTDIEPKLFCMVCDGMGVNKFGGEAAKIAVKFFEDHLQEDNLKNLTRKEIKGFLREMIFKAHRKILESKGIDITNRFVGTTLSALLFFKKYYMTIHIGDSRIYLFRNDKLKKLTKDHTIQPRKFDISKKFHPSYTISNALGIEGFGNADISNLKNLEINDLFLLCTDGLIDFLWDYEICEILRNNPVEKVIDKLIERQKQNYDISLICSNYKDIKFDDTTIIIVKIVE
ncbi:MAG: protein phosphatase 2C domain-containing protein [Ignavibacteria bacterium]|nr:protein phosphatase 2C domain-containing protein [Ignavibacteria bacterium]